MALSRLPPAAPPDFGVAVSQAFIFEEPASK
jgi:hypothetical protein